MANNNFGTVLALQDIDPDLPTFLSLSSKLTGYSEDDLQQTGMLETYYSMLMKDEDQDGMRAFLKQARQVLESGDVHAEIKATFIDPAPNDGLAQRIILMWYTGIWTTMNQKDVKPQQARTAMISAQTYQEGLIWATADTHPAGAKQPGYGSWSRVPIPRFDDPDEQK
jgi:hypothetical protein